jgi:hypothetical protein
MSDQARVSSIDTLEQFRADLIQYVEKARVALEDAAGEVRRTRTWLESDRLQHWGREMKKRKKLLDQAEQELYSAKLTSPQAGHALQKMAVQRAEQRLKEAEEKMRVLGHWRKQFENRAGSLLRQLEPLQARVGAQLPQGVHALTEIIRALQAYAGTRGGVSAPATEEPGGQEGGQ